MNISAREINNGKKESAANCNYKCIISGEKFSDIHHLYGMNLILDEAMKNINLEQKIFSDYSDDDLNNILNEFLKVQTKYPLGVCLIHNIHKKFHDKYGYGNNIPQQFEDFKKTLTL